MHPDCYLVLSTYVLFVGLLLHPTQGHETDPSHLLPAPPRAPAQMAPADGSAVDSQPRDMAAAAEFLTAPAPYGDWLMGNYPCSRYAGHLGIMPPEPVEPPVALRSVPVHELWWPVIDQADFQWMWVPD